jgi:micrococcal nuclease
MKNKLNWTLAIVLTLITSVSAGKSNYKITRVIDGDTIEFRAEFLPAPLKPVLSLRIVGVDTPEKGSHSHCELEAGMAQEATDFTKSLVEKSSDQVIIIKGWDKYGGRVLGDVFLDGKSLRTSLLDKGFARPYFGNKKQSWCEE